MTLKRWALTILFGLLFCSGMIYAHQIWRPFNQFQFEDFYYSYPSYTGYPYYPTPVPIGSNAFWEDGRGGNVPPNALIYYDNDNNPYFECRAALNNRIYYGILRPHDVCYVNIDEFNNSNQIHFDSYQVLTGGPINGY